MSTRLLAGFTRRLRSLRRFDDWCTRREEQQRFDAAIGHLSRGKSLLMHLDAASEPEHFFALAQRLLTTEQLEAEICPFLELAAAHGPTRRILEIGTGLGGTNFLLAHALPGVEMLIGLDLRVLNQRILRFFRQPAQRFEYLDGSSRDPATLQAVRALLGERQLDLLFLDGDHSWDGAVADFRLYREFVRPGGLIAFHDIVPARPLGTARAAARSVGDMPRLWAELKPHFRAWEFVHNPGQDGFGIGALEHDPAVALPAALRA